METRTETTRSRLTKSATDRMIDGVCGGVAAYLGVDPSIVRVAWVLLALAGGIGILLYFLAIVIMPSPMPAGPSGETPVTSRSPKGILAAGIGLVLIGMVFLLKNLGFFGIHFPFWFLWKIFLPVLLILFGVILLFRTPSAGKTAPSVQEGNASVPDQPVQTSGRRLYRSRGERKIFGVCSGLGYYFDIDPTLVRVLFVGTAFLSFGTVLIAYLLLAILIPEEPLRLGPA